MQPRGDLFDVSVELVGQNNAVVQVVLLGRFVDGFDHSTHAVFVVWVLGKIAEQVSHPLHAGREPVSDEPTDFGRVHNLCVVYVAVDLALHVD